MKVKKSSPFIKEDWDEKSLNDSWKLISKIGKDKYGLEIYEPRFEIVNFEDMLKIFSSGLPIMYEHWSFGKRYEQLHKRYINNKIGLAYEVIFNTNPAICYLMEHNNSMMQGLVMAHAAIGHSAFFRNNVLFKEFTNANTIVAKLKNMRNFVQECEEKHGLEAVTRVLDVCHSLQMYSIDRMLERKKTAEERNKIKIKRANRKEEEFDKSLEQIEIKNSSSKSSEWGRLREENILKFVGKFSPTLKPWERQLIEYYCGLMQYLYPQYQTKVMNEGFASFWHYTLMNDLQEAGYLSDCNMLEFIHNHCGVLNQPDYDSRIYSGINPYKLGFSIFSDIRRICENPTEEDKEWFPGLIGKDWLEEIKFAAYNFKDSSFILQYLSPKVIRDLKLFNILDDSSKVSWVVSDIHDEEGYKKIRRTLADSYDFALNTPDVYIEGWDARKSRALYVVFKERNGRMLDIGTGEEVLEMIKSLWGFKVHIKWFNSDGDLTVFKDEK